MDYKDVQRGSKPDNFWFKAKTDLLGILAGMVSGRRRDLRILNLGCGTGDDLKVLNRFGINHVVDVDKQALDMIDGHLCAKKIVADACDMPFEDGFFDIVIVSDVLEHIEKDEKAINEIYRVLTAGGSIIFTVPACPSIFSNHDRALGHYRRYDRKSIKALLSRFENRYIHFWNSILFLPIAMVRILNKHRSAKVDGVGSLPAWLDSVLYWTLSIDNIMIRMGITTPWGISLVGYARKPLRHYT